MTVLDENWLTNGLIDIEYKKYIMMSYIQHVQNKFSDKKLYPVFNDLKSHYQNLQEFNKEKHAIEESFPKRISKFDLNEMKIRYRQVISREGWASELNEIVQTGLKLFGESIEVGNELVREIIEAITIAPIGVLPIYKNEGYILVSTESSDSIKIFKYALSPIVGLGESEQISTSFVASRARTLMFTYEKIKSQIARAYTSMPNPATYSVHCADIVPFTETLLPVVKNLLRSRIAA